MIERKGPDGTPYPNWFEEQREAEQARALVGAKINSGDLPDQPAGNAVRTLDGAPNPWSGLTSGR